MEVAQIARTIARALGLNEDLAEALALAHDIGHPPFGHAGERALDQALQRHGLHFDHNLHALRIVEHFENRHLDFRGLNLTLAVREGIVKHSRDYSASEHPELAPYSLDLRPPLEAQIIDLADEIAYLTADLDDGVEADILTLQDIRSGVHLFERHFAPLAHQHPAAPDKLLFQESLKLMLNALADDLVLEIGCRVAEQGIQDLEGVRRAPQRLATFSTEMERLRREAKDFLYRNLYLSHDLQRAQTEAEKVVSDLFALWIADPDLLPPAYSRQVPTEGAPRVVADYIAGMTDHFVSEAHRNMRKMVVPSQPQPSR